MFEQPGPELYTQLVQLGKNITKFKYDFASVNFGVHLKFFVLFFFVIGRHGDY